MSKRACSPCANTGDAWGACLGFGLVGGVAGPTSTLPFTATNVCGTTALSNSVVGAIFGGTAAVGCACGVCVFCVARPNERKKLMDCVCCLFGKRERREVLTTEVVQVRTSAMSDHAYQSDLTLQQPK